MTTKTTRPTVQPHLPHGRLLPTLSAAVLARQARQFVQADGAALAVVAAEEALHGVQKYRGVALGLTQLRGGKRAVLTLRAAWQGEEFATDQCSTMFDAYNLVLRLSLVMSFE